MTLIEMFFIVGQIDIIIRRIFIIIIVIIIIIKQEHNEWRIVKD